jgi:hypothetical protein
MYPVFLFDMSVVIFLVDMGSGIVYRHRSVRKMSIQMQMYTFRAVVAIEAFLWERSIGFDVLDGLKHALFSFSPHGSLFGPSGGDVHTVNGIDKHACDREATVSDGIGLKESGLVFFPLAGFVGPIPVCNIWIAKEPSTVNGGSRDTYQSVSDLIWELLLIKGEP